MAVDGTVLENYNLSASLRHAPISIGDGLLLHVQEASLSRLLLFNSTSNTLAEIAVLGRSPAIPLVMDTAVVLGDSDGLTFVQCDPDCIIVDTYPTKVNGEMRWRSTGQFVAPVNTEEGGWLSVVLNDNGTYDEVTLFSTPYDGYGTSAPAWTPTGMYLGNDAGVLMAYTVERMNTGEEAATASTPLIGLTAITLGFIGAAWLSNRGRTTDAWRLLTLGAVAVALLMLPDLATSWNTLLAEEAAPSSEETPWDPSWPDEWLGTQIVVFDLPDQTVVAGGLVGHETVWSLTAAAAEERDLSHHRGDRDRALSCGHQRCGSDGMGIHHQRPARGVRDG